jgi:DMSO/TMAO reductase YedYZ molybdopterin-dependent catalytic subunit
VEVILIGSDRGMVDAGKKTASPGPIAFARSLPIAKAMSDSVVLAHSMNGEALTKEHGFRSVPSSAAGSAWLG